jgi:ribose 5-phosphate isomerase A
MTISDQQRLKIEVAKAAVAEVPAGAILGVGTGSTVDCFIDELAHAKIKLQAAVSSSRRTTERLTALGYKVIGLEALAGPIDLYIDGADEIDPNLCMIKGGGGALTQEKIVASATHRFICIVDASKRVEVIAAAIPSVTWAVRALGGEPSLRPGVITDNGHPILDVRGLTIQDPKAMETALNQIPGIVTNGIFALRPADLALVASNRGVIRLQHK